MTKVIAGGSWLLLERTSASTTAERLATAATRTAVSVECDRPSSSARRLVPAGPCGQQVRQTQISATDAAIVQLASGTSCGWPRRATAEPPASPTASDVSTRSGDRIRDRPDRTE